MWLCCHRFSRSADILSRAIPLVDQEYGIELGPGRRIVSDR